MVNLKHLDCPECGVVEHIVSSERCVCLGCGDVNEGAEMGDCRFDECPDDATHLVVYNPVGRDRVEEYYCESHAELAAREAEADTDGDLFLGPRPIEE